LFFANFSLIVISRSDLWKNWCVRKNENKYHEFVTNSQDVQLQMFSRAGVGAFRKPPVFLKPGDVVSCEIDQLGSVTNPIVSEVPKYIAKL
jgi:hypothetical protein